MRALVRYAAASAAPANECARWARVNTMAPACIQLETSPADGCARAAGPQAPGDVAINRIATGCRADDRGTRLQRGPRRPDREGPGGRPGAPAPGAITGAGMSGSSITPVCTCTTAGSADGRSWRRPALPADRRVARQARCGFQARRGRLGPRRHARVDGEVAEPVQADRARGHSIWPPRGWARRHKAILGLENQPCAVLLAASDRTLRFVPYRSRRLGLPPRPRQPVAQGVTKQRAALGAAAPGNS